MPHSAVRSLDQPNVSVRTVESNSTSAYEYMTVRIGKPIIKPLAKMGAKVSFLHKCFVLGMKLRP